MESQPQNPEFRISHEKFHPCIHVKIFSRTRVNCGFKLILNRIRTHLAYIAKLNTKKSCYMEQPCHSFESARKAHAS